MEDLTGKQLGPYQIVAQLGIGGMATVYKAYQPKMDRYVALKVLPRHFSKNPEFVSRFSQEALVIAQLEHPHILPVYDFGESDGYTYLVMRIVEGGSLVDTLRKTRKLELFQINRTISQVGGALDYAHSKGVIHRDFKPGNVLVDEFENCLLTDFGIAKLVETTSHLTHTGGILGTPTYISPEQGSGKPIDGRSGIYSLGVMLYQMVVGEVPYKADTPMAVIYKHVHDPLPLPRQRVPDIPEPVERVILKALAKEPDDRFSTAANMVDALQKAIEQPAAPVQEVVSEATVAELEPTEVVIEEPDDEKKIRTEPSQEAVSEKKEEQINQAVLVDLKRLLQLHNEMHKALSARTSPLIPPLSGLLTGIIGTFACVIILMPVFSVNAKSPIFMLVLVTSMTVCFFAGYIFIRIRLVRKVKEKKDEARQKLEFNVDAMCKKHPSALEIVGPRERLLERDVLENILSDFKLCQWCNTFQDTKESVCHKCGRELTSEPDLSKSLEIEKGSESWSNAVTSGVVGGIACGIAAGISGGWFTKTNIIVFIIVSITCLSWLKPSNRQSVALVIIGVLAAIIKNIFFK